MPALLEQPRSRPAAHDTAAGLAPAWLVAFDDTVERLESLDSFWPSLMSSTLRRVWHDTGAVVSETPSLLTPTGAPVELGWVWPRGTLRVAIDPCPGATAARRWHEVCHVAEISATVPDATALRYGGWLGLRPRDGVPWWKAYLELPRDWVRQPDALPAVFTELRPLLQLWPGKLLPVMIGLNRNGAEREIYYRCGRLFPEDVHDLRRRLATDRFAAFPRAVECLTGRRWMNELPSHDAGLSIVVDHSGAVVSLAIQSVASALLGSDDAVRTRLLTVGAEQGWAMDGYATVAAALPPRGCWHGIVAIGLDPSEQVTLCVGVTPPSQIGVTPPDQIGVTSLGTS